MDDLRELDAQIAEKVMGWDCGAMLATHDPKVPTVYSLPHYSTDIRFAFRVVKKMRQLGFAFSLRQYLDDEWSAVFYKPEAANKRATLELAATAAEVVCRAALTAIEATPTTTE